MKTMIISAFPGCGKTYLCDNQKKLRFKYMGEKIPFSFLDIDTSIECLNVIGISKKNSDWEKQYVEYVKSKIGTVDFIFIGQYETILEELSERNIPFFIVAPDNSEWISEKERQLIKQQWFGRFLLRDNSHIKNFDNWLEDLRVNYDNYTNIDCLTKHQPTSFFLLKENEYLQDIIEELYWRKETYRYYGK